MTRSLSVLDQQARQDAIAAAVRALRNGRLVALPAETGYVLAADAFHDGGVEQLRSVKGLGLRTSLGVLVGSVQGVHGIGTRLSPEALDLMAATWPGQLSLVVRTQPSLRWTVPTDRCVVRMPLHPVLLQVVEQVGPMVYSGLGASDGSAAFLRLEAGQRPAGQGSTVVDATGPQLRVVREGAVPLARLVEIVPSLGEWQ